MRKALFVLVVVLLMLVSGCAPPKVPATPTPEPMPKPTQTPEYKAYGKIAFRTFWDRNMNRVWDEGEEEISKERIAWVVAPKEGLFLDNENCTWNIVFTGDALSVELGWTYLISLFYADDLLVFTTTTAGEVTPTLKEPYVELHIGAVERAAMAAPTPTPTATATAAPTSTPEPTVAPPEPTAMLEPTGTPEPVLEAAPKITRPEPNSSKNSLPFTWEWCRELAEGEFFNILVDGVSIAWTKEPYLGISCATGAVSRGWHELRVQVIQGKTLEDGTRVWLGNVSQPSNPRGFERTKCCPPGNVAGGSMVDQDDLNKVKACIRRGESCNGADANGDGRVDQKDIDVVLRNLGESCW